MTIYSHHASRGKVQILATYRGPAGVVSSTVTSVDNLMLAVPIVSALNRISACATVPISVYDERGGRFAHYPTGHLAALADRNARPSLLEGAHSLWYEQAMVLLHEALTDLDIAVAAVAEPIKKAINAELEADARGLQDELAEYSEGIEPPEEDRRRLWDFNSPMVVLTEAVSGLGEQSRVQLNDVELGLARSELEQAAASLRLLLDVYRQCASAGADLLIEGFEISDDPYDEDGDRFFLNLQAPIPNGKWKRIGWNVEICRWVPTDSRGGDSDSFRGESVLDCVRIEQPALSELVGLLNTSNGDSEVLAGWAKTAVGEPLAGTAFVVTKRYED